MCFLSSAAAPFFSKSSAGRIVAQSEPDALSRLARSCARTSTSVGAMRVSSSPSWGTGSSSTNISPVETSA